MRPLFPYFGSKGRAAALVWEALGDPDLYLEPFAGSLAVLLARPSVPRVEVAVDTDGLIVNFYRTLRSDPGALLDAVPLPVAEVDVWAAQVRLIERAEGLTEHLRTSPYYFNAPLAGLWWYGVSSWLGSGFPGRRPARQRPHIDRSLKGLHARGMHDDRVLSVAARLANVVLLADDWQEGWLRVFGGARNPDSVIDRWAKHDPPGSVGVFLDPPYARVTAGSARSGGLYRREWDADMTARLRAWCVDHTEMPHVSVVLAGYDDEYELPGWNGVEWHAPNGYAQEGNARRHREVLLMNPAAWRRFEGTHLAPGVHPNQMHLEPLS